MNTIEGLNKVDCFLGSSQSAYEGSTVTISNGNNTWSKEIVDGHAVFMIPNIPAPAKQSYTITLPNEDPEGDPVYQRTIELGFGDSVKIGLYEENEPADQGDIGAEASAWTGKLYNSFRQRQGVQDQEGNRCFRSCTYRRSS